MALILCPECGNQISDKAISCPNCGNPINTPIVNIVKPIDNRVLAPYYPFILSLINFCFVVPLLFSGALAASPGLHYFLVILAMAISVTCIILCGKYRDPKTYRNWGVFLAGTICSWISLIINIIPAFIF